MAKKSNKLIILCLLIVTMTNAQIPNNDKSWILDRNKSIEFNSNTIDNKKWDNHPDWGTCWRDTVKKINAKYSEDYIIKNGILLIKVEKRECKCYHVDNNYIKETGSKIKYYNASYVQGALFSKHNYRYGYIEMRCKLPNKMKYKGINPSFWLYTDKKNSNGEHEEWNEIDIFEINGYRNIHTCNVHYLDTTMIPNPKPKNKKNEYYKWELRGESSNYDFEFDSDSFHTFACEWTPWHINFYYDDKLIRSTNIEYCEKLKPMKMLVTIEPTNGKFGDNQNNISQNTNFPYEFQIDYIRYYTMKMDCKTVVNLSNFNFDKFDYAVKKSITIKNSSVPKNKKYTLRATDFIELQGNFEVPLGSELTLMPTPEF